MRVGGFGFGGMFRASGFGLFKQGCDWILKVSGYRVGFNHVVALIGPPNAESPRAEHRTSTELPLGVAQAPGA